MGKLEDLEKRIKIRIKAKHTILTSPLEKDITRAVHEAYLESLESRAIDMQPSMYYLDSEGNKKYARLRNIILSTFALLEAKIDYLLIMKLDKTFTEFPYPNRCRGAINIILSGLNFDTKLNSVEAFYQEEKIDIGSLKGFCKVRNAFAHSLNLTSKHYFYKKINVTTNMYSFSGLIEKTNDIMDKLDKVIEKQPEKEELNKKVDAYMSIMFRRELHEKP